MSKSVGDYQLIRRVGRGATAEVYLAQKAQGPDSARTQVAIKVFHPSLWEEEDLRRRAFSEFETQSSLTHPHIVRVHEALWEQKAVVMEWMSGGSLETYQSRIPYVLPEIAVLIAIDILKALEFAHAQGVIHRDLKPANILLNDKGEIKVTDFGHAKILGSSTLTLSGTILGTPDFMSPEAASGDQVNESSDLFSVAAILYFLVTGTKPFTRHSPLATLAAVTAAEFEEAPRRNPKISKRLAALIHQGLSRNPLDRPASARDMREQFEAYLDRLGLREWRAFGLAQTDPTTGAQSGDAAGGTMNTLKVIANHLGGLAQEAVSLGRFDVAGPLLTHLSLVAPESAVLARLLSEVSTQRMIAADRKKKKTWAAAVLLLLLVSVSGVAIWKSRSQGDSVANGVEGLAPAGTATPGRTGATAVERNAVRDAAKTPATTAARNAALAASSAANSTTALSNSEKGSPAALVNDRVLRSAAAPTRGGSVSFDLPPGVSVIWDGVEYDPHSKIAAPRVGRHILRLEKAGTKPIEQKIWVRAGEPTQIRVR